MQKLTLFKTYIPSGMKVFEHGLEVVGVNSRQSYARRFLKRSMRQIYLQPVPGNGLDTDTLLVMSKSRGWFLQTKKCIGHVPADVAWKLIATGMENRVIIRLQLIHIEDKDSVHIRFNVLGPIADFERYCSCPDSPVLVSGSGR
jgi:hypothetical protein